MNAIRIVLGQSYVFFLRIRRSVAADAPKVTHWVGVFGSAKSSLPALVPWRINRGSA
jgi:hypothetical protein